MMKIRMFFLSIVVILSFQPHFAYGSCCANYYVVMYPNPYSPGEYMYNCQSNCVIPNSGWGTPPYWTGNASNDFGTSFGTIVDWPGNCGIVCEAMCYEAVYAAGGAAGCAAGGGSSYGGCMGGGYTTGGKPAPAPGKVIKSLIPGQ